MSSLRHASYTEMFLPLIWQQQVYAAFVQKQQYKNSTNKNSGAYNDGIRDSHFNNVVTINLYMQLVCILWESSYIKTSVQL